MNKEIKEYVNSLNGINISEADKQDFIRFCRKEQYIQGLMKQMYEDVHRKMHYGYGDYDASIVFVYQNMDVKNRCVKSIETMMNKFSVDIFSTYCTYIDKTDVDYTLKYTLLAYELNCVSPQIVYFICDNEECVDKYNLACSNNGISACKVRYVQANVFEQSTISKEILSSLKAMILKKKILRRQDYVKTN